jgi:hypothetical protein
MDKILAKDKEQFGTLDSGYKSLQDNFSIEKDSDLIIMNGISGIYIFPMQSFGNVLEVSKKTKSLEWNLNGSGKGKWEISGPDSDYTIFEKKMDEIVNY